jgi:hypothetical protein
MGKKFHLGDILSITTHRLVSPDLMDGVHGILNYMTQEDLYVIALPRAADECIPYLIEAMPWLEQIEAPDGLDETNLQAWLSEQVAKYGEYHEVSPIHPDDHEVIDVMEEIAMMNPDAKIVTMAVE